MKIRIILVAALAIFLLAACSSEPDATPTPQPAEVANDNEAASPTEEAAMTEVETPAAEEEAMPEMNDLGLPPVDPLALSGDIVTAGSSTVFPLSERMAERFQDEGYSGLITID
ncbi:MAG: phosphate-binding protein, partial [Chloroflexota bacterium]